jgi:hypothetical protein
MFQGDWHTTGVWVARKCVSELEFFCPTPLCITRFIASRGVRARPEYFTGITLLWFRISGCVYVFPICTCTISASVSFESSYRPLGNEFLLLYNWTWRGESRWCAEMTKRVNCSALDNEYVSELGIFLNFQAYNRLKCKHDIYMFMFILFKIV